ncbi:MAG: phosphoribosylanthranilate isomerase [Verrucomicrobiales bacterium]|nr:phosphoribosylanthranilate isomerase [Verrucomicrobiales bacterium]
MAIRVKICGITTLDDALAAAEAGADALGFMFYPPSPRAMRPDQVRRIVESLPPFVARVGVFVNADLAQIRAVAAEAGIDTVQLHGKESADFCRGLAPMPVMKAFRMEGPGTLATLEAYSGCAWLLDSYVAGVFGGTGQTFNWDLACEAVRRGGRVVLAGGLTPDNVARAVAAVSPYGVDVSSGVESAPGRKDAAKLRDFIQAAKAA